MNRLTLRLSKLRIRWRRLTRRRLRQERCEVCGRRMPLNGSGITETRGPADRRFHEPCYMEAMAHESVAQE